MSVGPGPSGDSHHLDYQLFDFPDEEELSVPNWFVLALAILVLTFYVSLVYVAWAMTILLASPIRKAHSDSNMTCELSLSDY